MKLAIGAALAAVALVASGTANAAVLYNGSLTALPDGFPPGAGPRLVFDVDDQYRGAPITVEVTGGSALNQARINFDLSYEHWKYSPGSKNNNPAQDDFYVNNDISHLTCIVSAANPTCSMSISNLMGLTANWANNVATFSFDFVDDFDTCDDRVITGQYCKVKLNPYGARVSLEAYMGLGDTTGAYAITSGSAVPEPATWAMMIIGFGLAGTSLRRRHAAPAAC